MTILAAALESLPYSGIEDKFNPEFVRRRIGANLRKPLKLAGFKLKSVEVSDTGDVTILASAPFDLLGVPLENRTNDKALVAYIEGPDENAFNQKVWDKLRGTISYMDVNGWDVGGEIATPGEHYSTIEWSGELQFVFNLSV